MYIKVHVTTKSKKVSVIQKSEDTFHIAVKEKPEMNMANMKVRELLAKQYNTDIKYFRIISGHQKPSKIILFSSPGDSIEK